MICERTACLVHIALALGVEICVEQPAHGRGLVAMKQWQELWRSTTMYRANCRQGAYSAKTAKRTSLFSNHVKWGFMKNELTPEDVERLATEGKVLTRRKRDAQGRLRITGIPGVLKSTQSYTVPFGRALVAAWRSRCAARLRGCSLFKACCKDEMKGITCAACAAGQPPPMFEDITAGDYDEDTLAWLCLAVL